MDQTEKAGLKFDGVGRVIRELREAAGLTQQALADKLEWTRDRVWKYESDALQLSIPVLKEIALALGQRPEVVGAQVPHVAVPRAHFPGIRLGQSAAGRGRGARSRVISLSISNDGRYRVFRRLPRPRSQRIFPAS